MKKALLVLVLASVFIAKADNFVVGRWYVVHLTSGASRGVIVEEIKGDCMRVSPFGDQDRKYTNRPGEKKTWWICIRNIESFEDLGPLDRGPDK